jgi:hypothetical protein
MKPVSKTFPDTGFALQNARITRIKALLETSRCAAGPDYGEENFSISNNNKNGKVFFLQRRVGLYAPPEDGQE